MTSPPKHTPESIQEILALRDSGYLGVLSNGRLVDRRDYPEAVPMQKNRLLGVPEPKKLEGEK